MTNVKSKFSSCSYEDIKLYIELLMNTEIEMNIWQRNEAQFFKGIHVNESVLHICCLSVS
jgi:hypothetical protein